MSDPKISSPASLTDGLSAALQEDHDPALAAAAVSIDLGESTSETSSPQPTETSEQLASDLQLRHVASDSSIPETSAATSPTTHESSASLKFSTTHVSSDFMDMDDVRNSVKELLIPVMMSGLGNLGAGVILSKMISLPVFRAIPWLIALVPALLGLKGNVEMTLSSRLTTQAHLGHLDDKEMRREILVGNLALAQAQASGVGIIAPIIAILISFFQTNMELVREEKDEITTPKSLLSISAAVATSGIADIVLASTMSMVIILAHLHCRVDVDNIATPIAASLGDVVTMALFSGIAVGMFNFYQDPQLHWLLAVPLIFYIGVCSYSSFLARRNPHVSKQIIYGWNPLLVSMLIQNLSGMVMEKFSRDFPRMTVFQPIINGFGGNLVAIQCSRIATHLQKSASKKELLSENEPCCSFPWIFFFGKGRHGKLASVLVLLAGPLQIPFVIGALLMSDLPIATPLLFIFYYVAATLQVIIILYVGYCFINILWLVGINPDNSSIPILTALADLLGCILMAITSLFLELFDDPNALPYRNEPHIIIASNSTIY